MELHPREGPSAAPPKRSPLHEIALRLDQAWDHTSARFRGTPKRITVEPYLAHGSADLVVARGRVVADAPIRPAEEVEPVWPRVRRSVRRFLTSELAGIEIEARLGSATGLAVTDEEGYYRIQLTGHTVPDDRLIHDLGLAVRTPPVGAAVTIGPAQAHIPPPGTRRLIVSDIDDTVLATGAIRTARMLLTTVTGSAWTRQGFPGTPELYAGLGLGDGDDDNAFVYVSSSPWNLHGFLDAFLRRTGLPTGPLFLRDLGVDETMFIRGSHDEHKRGAIEELLALHDVPLVLIGDTGERDPEIYRSVIDAHRGRIEAVLFRHVSSDERAVTVRSLFEETGVPMALEANARGLADRCESIGLIPPGWTARVAGAGDE